MVYVSCVGFDSLSITVPEGYRPKRAWIAPIYTSTLANAYAIVGTDGSIANVSATERYLINAYWLAE